MNKKGFTIIEMLVTVASLAIVFLGSAHHFQMTKNENKKQTVDFAASVVRNKILKVFHDKNSWSKTMEQSMAVNGKLNCFTYPLDLACVPEQIGSELILIDVGNPNEADYNPAAHTTPIYRTDSGGVAGFNMDGEYCNTFDIAVGNSECPIRVDFEIDLQCLDNPCMDRDLTIRTKFSFKDDKHTAAVNIGINDFIYTHAAIMSADTVNCLDNGGVVKQGVCEYAAIVDTDIKNCVANGGSLEGAICEAQTKEILCADASEVVNTFRNDGAVCE